jgi:hypothetical protein
MTIDEFFKICMDRFQITDFEIHRSAKGRMAVKVKGIHHITGKTVSHFSWADTLEDGLAQLADTVRKT